MFSKEMVFEDGEEVTYVLWFTRKMLASAKEFINDIWLD